MFCLKCDFVVMTAMLVLMMTVFKCTLSIVGMLLVGDI